MFFSAKLFRFIALVLAISLVSCRGYQKLLKSTDYELKYKKAIEYYEKKDYIKAQALFEELTSIYRGTQKAADVYYYYAYCYYNTHDNIMASYHFSIFSEMFPNSSKAEEAEYMSAYCYFLDSPPPALDQDNTLKAIELMQLFINKHPSSERVKDANTIIDKLRKKLEEKSFLNARLYYDLGDFKASIVALKNSLREFPDSHFREDLSFLLLKSHFLLATNSIIEKKAERYQNTIDQYITYTAEFPSSTNMKEAKRIYSESLEKIQKQ
jgi:outer membrane protein assembly factor BamD